MTKKKRSLLKLTGRINDVQIGERAKGSREKLRPVSILVQLNTEGEVRFEWFALGREVRSRVKELVLETDEVIGRDFELFVNDEGQVDDFRRLAK